MTSTHHAREDALLWDYPEGMPRIVAFPAIALCAGICLWLMSMMPHDGVRFFSALLGIVFGLAGNDLLTFAQSRVPSKPRPFAEQAVREGAASRREWKKWQAEHRHWRRRVAVREEALPVRRAAQRAIRLLLPGVALCFATWAARTQLGLLPEFLITVEMAVAVVFFVAAAPAMWVVIKTGFTSD